MEAEMSPISPGRSQDTCPRAPAPLVTPLSLIGVQMKRQGRGRTTSPHIPIGQIMKSPTVQHFIHTKRQPFRLTYGTLLLLRNSRGLARLVLLLFFLLLLLLLLLLL